MIYYHVMIHWDEITEADYLDDVKIDLFQMYLHTW